MSAGSGRALLEQARAAASRGDWQRAFDLFVSADADDPLTVADLPVLGEVAYAAGHLEVSVESWERAYVGLLHAGDAVGAAGAAVRVAMHLLLDTALFAPVRGWLSRAEGLLDGHPETAAHAWVALGRTYERLLTGDLRHAGQWARRAVEVGSGRDAAAVAIGRVAAARLLILDGDVEAGLTLLDEAGVAAVSGDLDALSTGIVYCELVCALQGLAQYDVAEQWTEAMERWSSTNAIGSLHGRCRVHRAQILRLRGLWNEAETEVLAACAELRPYLRREMGWPLTELGLIRLRKGDVEGAEQALLDAHRTAWDPHPGLALVRLAQGDVAAASVLIRDALERPLQAPSKERPPNTELRRAPLLEAQVQIELARGDVDRARAAASELAVIAGTFHSKALLADSTLAAGRVALAAGDAAEAEQRLSEAARLWNEVGAPYEAAVARAGLAEALRASGREERAALEAQAAHGALAGMQAGPRTDLPGRAASDEPVNERASAALNLFRREGDYWSVMFEDRTVRIRDLKGMRYLARLLADPAREFHVLDLAAAEVGLGVQVDKGADEAFGDAGEVLDARAKNAYRRRLAEIDEDIEQARAGGDAERAAQGAIERDFLVRELSYAVGLGGRGRRAGSASERARAAVTRAVRQAMARIGQEHPQLGEHLGRTVRTGTYCSYVPDPRAPVMWGR